MKIILSTLFLILTGTILAQVPAYVPTSGLVGWWPFSGNANDLSGNGNHGAVTGATLSGDRFGNANQAYAFNGVNCCGTPDPIQEIFISNQIINLGQNYTVSCWMKSTNVSKYQQLLFLAGSAVELNNEHVPTKLTYAVGPGTSWDLLYAPGTYTGFQNNVWYHVVFVKSGTSYTLYLNTNLEGSSTVSSSASYTQTSDFRIGSLGGGHEVFKGSLDDFAVWNRALTSSEISGLYTATSSNGVSPAPLITSSPTNANICTGQSATLTATPSAGTPCSSTGLPSPLTTGLVSYWPFCGNANDASGNGNNGTVNGPVLTTDRFGNSNSAYSFDGVNDYIQTSFSGIAGSNSRSVSFWAQTSGPANSLYDNMNAICYGSLANGGNWEVALNHACQGLTVDINQGVQTASCNTNNNTWNHFTVVFDNTLGSNFNAVKFYCNGVLLSTICQVGQLTTINSSTANTAVIGAYWNHLQRFFYGKLDDIGVWNRALSSTEIQQLYTLGNITYSWSPGGATTTSITVSPTTTTTYTCTVTDGTASSNVSQTVTVNSIPTVNAGSDQTVFAGTQVTLAGSGATTYSWDNGVTNNMPFTATTTNTYTVTGTSNGCTATDQVLLTVLPAPTVSTSSSTICAGQSTTLTATSTGSGTPCASTGLPSSLTTGLVGYWPFCGNANDASGNGNNGTVNGATLTTDRFGSASSAYSFDGNSDVISTTGYSSTNSFTSSVWVKMSNLTGYLDNQTIVVRNNDGLWDIGYDQPTNKLFFGIYNGSWTKVYSPVITANQWVHVVAVFQPNNQIKIYFNGVLSQTQNISISALSNLGSELFIGGEDGSPNKTINGSIDDLHHYNYALTATEIQQLYTLGNATYSWSPGGATTSSITVSPTSTTTYTCTITNGGATSTVSQTVTVNAIPTVNAGADQTVFAGTQVTLAGSGATTYSWNNGVTNNTPFTATATTTYTVTGTSNGCTATDQVLVTVLPAPTVSATNSTICVGSSTTLTAASTNTGTPCASTGLSGTLTTGLVGYWPFCGNANDASGNGHNGTVNGATLTTDRFGSANSAYSFGPNFPTYIQLPEISNNLGAANASSTISIWSKSDHLTLYGVMLHASSSNQYIYGRIEENSNSKVKIYHRNPSENDEPTSIETTNVNDWNHYLATIDGSTGTYKFYVNGVEWTSMQFSFNPSNSYYQSNRTWQIGCISSDQSYHQWTGKIDDFGIWNRVLTASEIQQLASQSQVTYAWSPGGATTPSITVSPTATTTYTCLVTQGGATSTISHTITVNSTPTVSAGADQTVFAGSSVTLAGSGATTYSWNNGVTNNTPFTASATTTYTVTGTSNGCTATDQVLVTVLPAPTVTATNSTICAGSSTTLTAASTSTGTPCASTGLPSSLTTGLVGYWPFCGNANDASGNGNNGTTMNGVALTTDRFGNSNSAYSFDGVDDYIDLGSYILNSPQEYTIDLWAKFNNSTFSYLFGQATNGEIQIQLDGSGNIKSWTKLTNGGNVSAGTSIPDYSNWHHVTAIFNNNTKILQFIIDGNVYSTTIPNGVNIQSFAGPALFGRQSNVNANFFNGLLDDVKIYNRALTLSEVQDLYNLSTTTYSWSPGGATTPSITVSPTTTTTYTCTITNGGATSTVSQTVTVNALPIANAGPDFTKTCVINPTGSSIGSTPVAGIAYAWAPSAGLSAVTSANPIANPTTTTNYTLTATNASTGCSATDQVTVTVNTTVPAANAGSDFTKTCVSNASGASIGSTAVAGVSYAWTPSTGLSASNIANPIANPTATTNYTLTATNVASGCTATDFMVATVNTTPPSINAGVDQNICSGSTATLTATGATSYSWTNSVQNGVAFTPIATTTYTVTGTDANGCTGTDAVTVTLVPTPTISATNASVCAGQSTTLTASTTSGTVACPSLSGSLTSGLVGYWPFCGNANDASGNGNNGTVNGATLTTDRFGNTNSAYSFNGSNSIDIGVNGFSTGNSQATLSGWVYITTNPAGVSYIVGYGNPANQGAVFATGIYGSAGLFGTFSGAVYDAISNINCPINSWNLVTTVKEANGTIKIYLNATLIYTQTVATPLIGNISGRIGRAVWNSSEYWNGKIDDVAVWNRALTATEIQQLYTTGQATYSWSPGGATTPSITVSPTTTNTYTCTVTDVNGNSCSATQTITVIPFNGVDAGADQSICSGGSVTLNATGATTFSWNNNVQNGVAFSPLSSGTYIVTGTQNGCTDADTVAVTVVADPLISNPVSASYCQNGGTAAALSASANGGLASAYTYQWYSNTNIANFGGTAIAGATSANYVPSLSSSGTFYYYCTVTQGSATSGCLATSGGASVSIGAQPAITNQPTASQSACVGASLNDLTITTNGGIGSATYQWYANTTASTTGGTAIVGANSASYAPSSTTAGNFYYYAMVSYPSAATSCAQATSQVANVNIINDPIFTQVPPANQTVCIGGTTPALTISTSGGSGTASYQWYLVNGNTYTTILGATSPSYTPPAFNLAGNYAYSVGMTQTLAGCGTGFSAVANVSVVADPTVSTPTGASYCQGGAASAPLTVIATGGINAGYTYQWYSNGSNNNTTGIPISGANAASYTPPTSTIGNLYYYCLVNQGSGCQASSAPAAIQVGPGPAFTTQPIASQTICAGASLNTLTVAYSGGVGTPTYQWYSSTTNNNFGGTPIAGASNASFTPNPNVVGLNYYYCVVSYAALTTCSSITSNVAQVNVISNPVFSSSPLASQTICQGSGAQTLSFATSGGSGTASYQWYNVNGSNYTPILGATGLNYTPPTNLPVGTYNYAVAMNQAASGCSTGFSSNSELVVLAQPVVSTPVGGVYCQGGSGQALSVSVSGGLGSSSYQWYQHTINSNSGGTVIPQATSSTYTPSLSSLGTLYYYCVVTQNAGCASSSAVATVVSNPSPVISTQPVANQTICTGGTPSALTVSYTGGVGAASYQWYSNAQNSNVGGTPITGATFNTYIPSNFTTVGSSFYYCVVSLSNSSCPIVTSNVAVVNAVANPSVNGPLSASYCQSTSVAQPLSVVANGGTSNNYNYQWYSNASNANFGGNPILGANNANYTPNINGSSTYYYCVVSQAGGCQTASTPAAVTIVSAPTVSSQALSPQSVCIGGTPQALTIATTGGVSAPSYQWYSNNTNTIVNAPAIANANSPSFTPNSASTSGTLYYFCQVTYPANSACPTLVSNAAIVNAVADPVVSSPNSGSYCQNTTSVAPLSVTASGGINTSYTYQWFSNTTNSTIGGTPIAGANTNTYVPLVNQIGTIYYYCEVTQGSGCAALSGLSAITVGVAATMNQQPITAQSLCLGQTPSPLTVTVSAGNYALTYQWYSNINNSTSGGSLIVGATSASYLPPSNVLGTKYYYCIVTIAGGGCGNLTSNTASISVVTTPSMFQPNSQSICCQASSAPVNFVGTASSYSWTASSSSPLLTGFSSTGNGDIPANVLINNSSTPQNIVYLVTPSNQGCNGTPVQFNISVMPCLSVSVPSDQYYCAGESVPAYVFAGVGQTYSWVNTNTTIGLQNAGINFVPNFVAQNTSGTTQVATISVTPNFMGCAGATQSYTIAIYPLPVMDAGLDQELCIGGSVTLNASGAPIVVWDNGIQDGLPFVPNSTATYTVTGTDNNGCQSSDVVVVTVNNPTSATLNVTTCDAYTLNGQTYTASGTYSQLLSNSAGCDSTLTLNLTLNYSPNQPNIYVQNQVNLSTDLVPGLTYQWIQCSDLTPISGQTAITYNPTSNGVYAVVVTNGCGSDTSLCTSITTIGLEEHLSSQILLYPNPNNGVFTLEMPQTLIGQTIQIFDMAGRLIQENTAQEMKQLIELNDVATGSYWLRIGSETPMKLVKN